MNKDFAALASGNVNAMGKIISRNDGNGLDWEEDHKLMCYDLVHPGSKTKCLYPTADPLGETNGREKWEQPLPIPANLGRAPWSKAESREHAVYCAKTFGCGRGCMGCTKKIL